MCISLLIMYQYFALLYVLSEYFLEKKMTKIYGSKILGSQQNFATFITKNTEFVLMKNKEENTKKKHPY